MRISEQLKYQAPKGRINKIRAKQASITEQLSSGQRLNRPSDDPLGALRSKNLRSELRRVEQYQRNMESARHFTAVADQTLGEAVNTLHRIKELTIQSISSTLIQGDRETVAMEIASLREHLRGLANTKTNNRYIFSGFASTTKPYDHDLGVPVPGAGNAPGYVGTVTAGGDSTFEQDTSYLVEIVADGPADGTATYRFSTDGGVTYDDNGGAGYAVTAGIDLSLTDGVTVNFTDNGILRAGDTFTINGSAYAFKGDENVTESQVGDQLKVETTARGGAAFGGGPSGLVDVFDNLMALERAVLLGDEAPMQDEFERLGDAIEQVSQTRQGVGVEIGRLEGARTVAEYLKVKLPEAISNVEDTDFATAVSDLQLAENALQATLAASARLMSGRTLLDYM